MFYNHIDILDCTTVAKVGGWVLLSELQIGWTFGLNGYFLVDQYTLVHVSARSVAVNMLQSLV